MNDLWDKLIKIGTFLVVFLTPFIYFGHLYLAFSSTKTFIFCGLVELIFTTWLYKIFTDKSYRFSKKELFVFLPILIFIFWLTLSAIFGVDPNASFWSSLNRGTGLITMYHLTAFIFVVASLIKKYGLEKYGKNLLGWFLGGVSILTLSVWLGNEGFNLPIKILEKSKGGGLMGNSSLAGAVLVFGFFFCLFLLFGKRVQKKTKIILGCLAAFILFSPAFINLFGESISARGALAGIFLGLVSFVPFILVLSKNRKNKFLGISIISIALIASGFIWIKFLNRDTNIHKKFDQLATDSRFVFWKSAGSAINSNPIFGLGAENFRVALQENFNPEIYKIDRVAETWSDRAHNIIFETGVAGGYPGIIFYLGIFVSIFFAIYKSFQSGRISKQEAAILGSVLVAYFIQNLFVFDSVASLMAFGILIGISFGLKTSEEKIKENAKENFGLAFILFLLFVTSFTFLVIRPVQKAVRLDKVISLSLNKRADHYNTLLRGSSVGDAFEIGEIADDAYRLYSENEQKILENPKMLSFAVKDLEKFNSYLEKVSEKHPQDLHLRFDLAHLYLSYMDLTGKKDDTEFVNKVLALENRNIESSPKDPEHYWIKAITLVKIGRNEEAKKVAKEALDMAPYIDFSQELLSKIK